ncbi:MAG: porphobilinogen synthase [Thermoplasmata archaeon]
MKMFPDLRLRRLRISPEIREILQETNVRKEKMIMPMFVDERIKGKEEISSMPGIFRYSEDEAVSKAKEYEDLGIKSVLLFGIPKVKDELGSQAYDESGIVQRTIKRIKEETNLVIFADLCLCEYTSHGHCGIINGQTVENDSTLELYAKIARSYAIKGVDAVAPSGMMDGQVARIRKELDTNGFKDTIIMAYSAKFASPLYSPFREAAYSAPSFGDRKSYQMNYGNFREAIREIEEDIEEGADIIMVKPALFYLDIIREARNRFKYPLAAYSVSAEYSMIMNAAQNKIIDLHSVIKESTTSISRAGADLIISYFTEYIYRNRIF